ncbi:sporulation protein YqfD [Lachnospiraceae bacterium 50-23]
MILKVIRYIKGYLRIRITGYSTERFLNACRHKGIFLWGLKPVSGAYEMNITVKEFRQLKPMIRKTGTKVLIVKRTGLPFFLYKYRKRKLFFGGACLCLFMILFMSRMIWGIDISGNTTYTDEALLKYLSSRNVKNGMAKSDVDCARIVKDIRKEYNDIIWVSASVRGTKLYIQIKENEDSIPVDEKGEENKAVDIVADRDCIVKDIVVRKGVVKVREGDTVKKGDVLISGQVPVNNDAKEVTGYQYHESDADILGTVVLPYEDECSHVYEIKEEIQEEKGIRVKKEEYFVTFGKWRFTFGSVENKYEHFEEYTAFKQLRMFENFDLPVTVGVRTAVPYRPVRKKYTKQEEQEILSAHFYRYLEELEKKGVEILENDVKIYTGHDSSRAKGSITVLMQVGEKKPSELLEIPKSQEEVQGESVDGNDGSNH